MKCRSIRNYLSFSVCLLNVFEASTNHTGFGNLTSKDDDYWSMEHQNPPANAGDDISRPYDLDSPNDSLKQSEPAGTSHIQLHSTVNDIEETFVKLNKSPLPWKEVENNDTALLQRICFSAWPVHIPNMKCESIPRPCGSKFGFSIQLCGKYYEVLRAHILRCKCYPDGMKREQVQSNIKALYLAKENDSSAFLLMNIGNSKTRTLRIIGMMPLNLTNIESSSSYMKPPSRTSSPLTWDLTQIEKEFYIIYNNFSDEVIWQPIRDNDTAVLEKICTAAWKDGPFKRCYGESKPYSGPKSNGMKAKLADNYHAITVRADFLQLNSKTDDDTGSGEQTLEDYTKDKRIKLQHSTANIDDSISELHDHVEPSESSRQLQSTGASNIELPSTIKDIEEKFFKLYLDNSVPWKEVEDNDTVLLQSMCFAAWPEDIPHKKCEFIAKPYQDIYKTRFRVEFPELKLNIELPGANLLRCKCYPNGMKRDQVRVQIKPLYLAKHDDLSVFLLQHKEGTKSHRLQIIGMIPLNLTDIISSRSSEKPPSRTSSPLTWDLTLIEREFYIIYNNFSDELKWDVIRDNDTAVLEELCIAMWDGPFRKCLAKPNLYSDPKYNGMKALLADNYNAISVRADFLQCKCGFSFIRDEVDPIYFAKYNSTTVFKLRPEDKGSHNLKVVEKIILDKYI